MYVLNNQYKKSFVFMLMVLISVQTSCGFHLRGAVGLPDHITPLFIDLSAVDDEMGRELKSLLFASGENNLAASMAEAKAVLNFSSVKKKKRVVATDNLGRAREYELNYKFSYELKNVSKPGMAAEIIKTNTIKLKRDLLFAPDSVLAVAHDNEALYDDMRKDAARLLLRQLSVIK